MKFEEHQVFKNMTRVPLGKDYSGFKESADLHPNTWLDSFCVKNMLFKEGVSPAEVAQAGEKLYRKPPPRDQIFVMGNPLLDISVDMDDDSLLKKYELDSGMAILAEEKHMPIYDEIWNMPNREAIPGGAALNSARAANYMLSK